MHLGEITSSLLHLHMDSVPLIVEYIHNLGVFFFLSSDYIFSVCFGLIS